MRIADELPATATNKILKRELVAEGTEVGNDTLWTRPVRERTNDRMKIRTTRTVP